MKAYLTYKDSGIEWVGDIPEHWDRTALKRVVKIKITDGPHETPEFLDNGIPFISAEGVKNGKVDFNYKRGHISKEVHELYSKKCKPEKGDVFIVKSGSTTGKVAYVDTDIEFNIWSPIALVRPKDEFTGKYLFYFCESECFQKQVQLFWSFGTQPNIGMGVLENLYIAFPSIEEQTSIANFLDHKTAQIDLSIKKRRELIELLKEQRAAIINEAVTKGINPNTPMKDSGIEWIGEVPEHWEVKKLKHELKSLNSIRVPLSSEERGRMENKKYDYYGASGIIDKVDEYLFDEDLILIGEDGANLITRSKRLAFIATGKYWVNNHAHILKPYKGNLKYYSELLETYDFSIWVTGSAQPKLTSENLSNVPIVSPPVDEQQQIIEYIETETSHIDSEIRSAQKEIDLLEEYRQSLIAEAVTGKIDVRDYPLDN